MAWYYYVVYFFIGALLINSVPHTVQGICGNRFQTPFGNPRGVGESSAIVNVIWGVANFAAALFLINVFPVPSPLPPSLWIATLAGAFALALHLANHFGKVRNDGPSA
jgi:hypothetical protein